MAEAQEVDNSDNSEENDEYKTDLRKCEKRLQDVKISPRHRKPWRLGFSSHKSDPSSTATRETKRKVLRGVSVLITAITAGDVDRSRQILDLVSQRALNKLVSVNVNEGTFKVTPLLWAVIHSRTEIVRLLIDRGVSVDRQGYLENDDVTHTYSPLMRALDNCDRDIVRMLLSAGADPYLRVSGPRLSEEEGGCLRYTAWLYPVSKAIATDDLETVQMFMQRYDPVTPYTDKYHTCLCFALCKRKLTNWYAIVKCLISYGGRVCNGLVVDSPRDKGMCSHFKMLVRSAFSIHYSNTDIKLECNFASFKVLSLVCQIDYIRPNASIGKALKQYFSFIGKARFETVDDFVCKRSFECFHNLLKYCETPTPLKQICRVRIRDCITCLNPDKYFQLPLPTVLQRYVGFMDEN